MPKYTIPHTSNFIPVKSVYNIPFNTLSDGTYTIDAKVEILKLEQNTVYFFESMEISADIDRNVYQSSIQVNPQLFLKRRLGNTIAIPRSIPISQFTDEKTLEFFIKNDSKNNYLDGELIGKLKQTPDLIGIDEINININFKLFAMNDKIFNAHFRDSIKIDLSKRINRG